MPAPHYPRPSLCAELPRRAIPPSSRGRARSPGLPYLRLHPTAQKASAQLRNLRSSFACHFLPKISPNSRFP